MMAGHTVHRVTWTDPVMGRLEMWFATAKAADQLFESLKACPGWDPGYEMVSIPATRRELVDWLNQWVNEKEVSALKTKYAFGEDMRQFMKQHGVE